MFSDLFYLSTLLDISLAFSKKEKQALFHRGKNNHVFCLQAINSIEKEIRTLTQYREDRTTKLKNLNIKTQKKMELITEVEYSNALKNKFEKIRNLELLDNN